LHDALIWAELGVAAFAAFFTIIVLEVIQVILFAGWNVIWISAILLSFVPLVLAILTYEKIMQPLMTNVVPSRRWASFLEIAGYVFGLFVGGVLLWIANKKVKIAQDQAGNSKPA